MIGRLRPHVEGRAPLVIAALFSVPIFMMNLLVASLAVDRPHVVAGTEHPPTDSTEAKVWAVAVIAPAILLAVGLLALPLGRLGSYVVFATAIVFCALMPSTAHGYMAGHARRFPLGLDYLKDSDPSNTSSSGEWERAAHDSITSMAHWTIALAALAVAVMAVVHVRGRRGRPVPPPPEAVVGVPETTPIPTPDRVGP